MYREKEIEKGKKKESRNNYHFVSEPRDDVEGESRN